MPAQTREPLRRSYSPATAIGLFRLARAISASAWRYSTGITLRNLGR